MNKNASCVVCIPVLNDRLMLLSFEPAPNVGKQTKKNPELEIYRKE